MDSHVIFQSPPVVANRLEVGKVPKGGLEDEGERRGVKERGRDEGENAMKLNAEGEREGEERRKEEKGEEEKRRRKEERRRAHAVFAEALEASVQGDALVHLTLDDLKLMRGNVVLHPSLLRRSPQGVDVTAGC